MDTDTPDIIQVTFTAYAPSVRARGRLVEEHGFTLDDTPGYAAKVADTTFEDGLLYANTLRGIVGVVSVRMDVGSGPEPKLEPAWRTAEEAEAFADILDKMMVEIRSLGLALRFYAKDGTFPEGEGLDEARKWVENKESFLDEYYASFVN